MTIARELQSAGLSALAASSIAGTKALTVTAAGVTAATATDLAAAFNVVTTCTEAACGVQLPANDGGDSIVVVNATANNLRVYPPTGGAFSGATADVPYTMAANSVKTFYQTSTVNYAA